RPDRNALGRGPRELARREAGRKMPAETRRLAGVAGIPPVDVPAALGDEAQTDVQLAPGLDGRGLGDERNVDVWRSHAGPEARGEEERQTYDERAEHAAGSIWGHSEGSVHRGAGWTRPAASFFTAAPKVQSRYVFRVAHSGRSCTGLPVRPLLQLRRTMAAA